MLCQTDPKHPKFYFTLREWLKYQETSKVSQNLKND